MHPLVRDLYKRFILAGRNYPQGINYIREKAKTAIFANKLIVEELEIKKCVSKGRFWVREIMAISNLHKYRSLKKRYPTDDNV